MTPSENNRRILVVDDEQSIVDAVATALRYEGYQVEEASTGTTTTPSQGSGQAQDCPDHGAQGSASY